MQITKRMHITIIIAVLAAWFGLCSAIIKLAPRFWASPIIWAFILATYVSNFLLERRASQGRSLVIDSRAALLGLKREPTESDKALLARIYACVEEMGAPSMETEIGPIDRMKSLITMLVQHYEGARHVVWGREIAESPRRIAVTYAFQPDGAPEPIRRGLAGHINCVSDADLEAATVAAEEMVLGHLLVDGMMRVMAGVAPPIERRPATDAARLN